VDDQVGGVEPAQALVRQPPRTSRQVRVGDDRDEAQPRRLAATRKARPMKNEVRAGFISAAIRIA
jgi:hypothetical protein